MAVFVDPSIDSTYRDSIRRLLGGVDAEVLSDEDIDDPIILDMAELRVIELLPDALKYFYSSSHETPSLTTSAESSKIRLATIYIMAALLCPSMAGRIEYEVKTVDTSWKRKPIDYDELMEKLLGMADSLLEPFIEELGGDGKLFAIAPSKRAVMHHKYHKKH